MENITFHYPYRSNEYVALIEINRPKVLNALNTETLKEIVLTLESLPKEIRAVMITGSEKAFSAGADLKKMVDENPVSMMSDERENLWKRFREIQLPTIAVVNGFCLGGGHELAMSCDMIIASDTAQFGQPEIGVGIMPGAGGTQRLTKALGKSKAMYYTLTGERFSAKEAYDWGLVSKVVPSKVLLQESFSVAKKITRNSPLAAKLIKESINASYETHLSEGLKLERRNFYLTFATQDQHEGMSAFLEKRKPVYKGK